jgi:hypothetical protein
MPAARTFSIVESASAAIRLDRAAAFLDRFPSDRLITIVVRRRAARLTTSHAVSRLGAVRRLAFRASA